MNTVTEIQNAIDALPIQEQEQVYSHLTSRLVPKAASAEHTRLDPDHDPVLDIAGIASDPSGPNDVAANYKEYLYGYGSGR